MQRELPNNNLPLSKEENRTPSGPIGRMIDQQRKEQVALELREATKTFSLIKAFDVDNFFEGKSITSPEERDEIMGIAYKIEPEASDFYRSQLRRADEVCKNVGHSREDILEIHNVRNWVTVLEKLDEAVLKEGFTSKDLDAFFNNYVPKDANLRTRLLRAYDKQTQVPRVLGKPLSPEDEYAHEKESFDHKRQRANA